MRKILFYCCVIAGIFSLTALVAAEDDFVVRNGITNSFILFEQKEYQQVAFFGNETLKGKRPYCNAVVEYFRKHFEGANIGLKPFPDQGGSWYGAFRVARAEPVFGATVHNACIEFIDFAPDDFGKNEQEIIDAWEGIVRGLLSFRRTMDIVFVYTLSPEMLPVFNTGQTPHVIRWAEKVAEHYGLPSVNLAKVAAEKINAGEISRSDFFAAGAQPSPKGEEIYAVTMQKFIDACLTFRQAEQNKTSKIIAQTVPAPISATNLEHAQVISYDWTYYPKNWIAGKQSPIPYFRHILIAESLDGADPLGSTLTMKFTGSGIGLLDLADNTAAVYEYSIDNSDWKILNAQPFNIDESVVRVTKIVDGLEVTKEHVLKLRFAEQQPAGQRTLRIGAFLVDGSVKDPYAGLSPLERADAVYAAMNPIQYDPPKDRWKHIPKTMEKLRNGETLKIVMLGDSIMGDTGSSFYDKILERQYPNCKIERIMSLRGSTGCWWYKDENRIENYVLKHNPDLLMIGGISQRGDIDSIRSVIHQVRSKQSPEIMLLTPVFGAESDPHLKNWTFEINAEKYSYRAELKKLAEDENCEFVDLTGITWKYMMDSGKCYGWFKRDYVHANQRGFQVIGRHLVRYLTSDEPK
ncbi:MAG: hypothetical protein LBC20_04375 [Planctomycetaceae bacterium]|jgi:hypothetical protein|nr:hypothetical protein [Planctomycetaceae bacterium]